GHGPGGQRPVGATQRVRGVPAPGGSGRDRRHEEHPTVLQLRNAQARVVRRLGSGGVALRPLHRGTESCRAYALGGGAGRGPRRGGVARLALGSRVGAAGPMDAVPLDSVLPSALPVTLEAAVDEAANQGPAYRLARANERQAAASFRSRLGTLLPRLSLTGVG